MNPCDWSSAPTLDHYPLLSPREVLNSKKEIKIIVDFNIAFMIAFTESFLYARHCAEHFPTSKTAHSPLRIEQKENRLGESGTSVSDRLNMKP